MDESMRLAQVPAAAHAFVSERFEAERERLHHPETAHPPLGWAGCSAKDLDLAGRSLRQALALQDAIAATSDAPTVARVCGRRRQHRRPHAHGGIPFFRHRNQPTFPNARGVRLPLWSLPKCRVSGRVSGAAVSVAMVRFAALGLYTGRSHSRCVQLALLFKSTARLVLTTGAVPIVHHS